jgi:hypothetical protein
MVVTGWCALGGAVYTCRIACVCLGLPLCACAVAPPLADDAITISEIVQRVKCEIWDAVPAPQGKYPTGPYQWLRDWTAKVDLTLETDDTGGISPGVSFINPMRSVTIPGTGTFSRMFSVGLGGGLNTQASRTETLSFTLSFAELQNPDYRGVCSEAKGLGLLGNLGLKEWMQAALAPTSGPTPELRLGYHAPPSSGAKAATPRRSQGPSTQEAVDPVQREIQKLNGILFLVDSYADEAQRYAKSAQTLANSLRNEDLTKAPQEFYRKVQSTVDALAMTQDAIDQANKQIALADTQMADMKKNYGSVPAVIEALKNASSDVTGAKAKLSAAAKTITAAEGALPPNGPIDSIAHQVSFVVSLSGNATPSWTLVHFKGPGSTNAGLVSASQAITHTLNISMGSPSNSGTGMVSSEQLRQLDYLHQSSAFRNALTSQPAVIGSP